MQKNIHPKYESIKVTCSCSNVIHTYSTVGRDLNIDVCNACHPFYTGKQRVVNTGGRINRFYQRFSIPVVKTKSS